MTIRLDVSGLERALRDALVQLDVQLPRALHMVGAIVRDRARQTTLFRDRTGTLRRSIGTPVVSGSFADGTLEMSIEAGLGNVSYARYVHDGTRAHIIRARRAKALRWSMGGNSGFRFARSVNHPGTAPRPFMYAALDASQADAQRILQAATELAFVRAGFDP